MHEFVTALVHPKTPTKRELFLALDCHLVCLSVSRLPFLFSSPLVSFLSCDGLVYPIQSHFLSFVRANPNFYFTRSAHLVILVGHIFLHLFYKS